MIALIFLLQVYLGKTACPTYRCDDSSSPSTDSCVLFEESSNTYWLHRCKTKGEVCDYKSDLKIANCTEPQKKPLNNLPGEPCTSDDDCSQVSYCEHKTCRGLAENAFCENNEDCDMGLYCHASKCIPQIEDYETGCLEDIECKNKSGCDISDKYDRFRNNCKPYLSLKNYETASACEQPGSVNYLCESTFCYDNGYTVQCYPPPVSKNPVPTECDNDGDCVSSETGESNIVYEGSCKCGYNSEGKSYCTVFAGDKLYLKYSSVIARWIKSKAIDKCNTVARFSYACMINNWGKNNAYEFLYYENYVFFYYQIVNTEDCTKEVLLHTYWEYSKKYDAALLLSVAFIQLFF